MNDQTTLNLAITTHDTNQHCCVSFYLSFCQNICRNSCIDEVTWRIPPSALPVIEDQKERGPNSGLRPEACKY